MGALGIGLGLEIRRGAAFDPVSLLAGRAGAVYDIAPGLVWQDNAGTVAAAAGDPVGRVTDRSGNGNHLVQAGAAAKPVLRQDSGGRFYLEFDGVDDVLTCAMALSQPWVRVSALRQLAWTANARIFGSSGTAGLLLMSGSAPQIRINSGLAGPATSAAAVGSNVVVSERHSGSDSRIAINALAYVTGDAGGNGQTVMAVGAQSAGSSPSSIRFYGMALRAGASSDEEVAQLRVYHAARAGVTL